MLLVVLVLSVWLGYRANKAANQRRAVALVKELGGSVMYDFDVANASSAATAPLPNYPSGTTWRTFLGWDVDKDGNADNLDESEVDIEALKFDSATEAAEIDVKVIDIGFDGTAGTGGTTFEFTAGSNGIFVGSLLTSNPPTTEPPEGPLYDLLGIDWFHPVERVYVRAVPLTDEQLGELVDALPALKQLDLSRTQVTDAGLVHLSRLKNLEQLWLSGTSVTDAGLLHLSGLKNLKIVETRNMGVTAEGATRLKSELPNLTRVILY